MSTVSFTENPTSRSTTGRTSSPPPRLPFDSKATLLSLAPLSTHHHRAGHTKAEISISESPVLTSINAIMTNLLSTLPTNTPMSSPITTVPTSVPTLTLQFELPSAFIPCSPSLIKWNYTGGPTSAELALTVNNDVPQDAPPPLLNSSIRLPISVFSNPNSRRQTSLIDKILSSQIDPTSGSFLWPSVNVPQGWYQLLASLPPYGQVNQTSTFYVHEGTDTSCFITSAVIEQNHTGAIIGGTVGGIAFLIGLFIGWLYMYFRRKNPRSSISCHIKGMVAHFRPTSFSSVAAAYLNTPQNSENVQGHEIDAKQSPRPAALALDGPSYSEQPVSSIYLRSDTSLESLDSYSSNPFVDSHFMSGNPSFMEGSSSSPRSSSWSFTAVTRPLACARTSSADPFLDFTENTSSIKSAVSTSSTALPMYYESRTPTPPPSFHTNES